MTTFSMDALKKEIEERLRESEKVLFVNQLTEIVHNPKTGKEEKQSFLAFIGNEKSDFERAILLLRCKTDSKKARVISFNSIRKSFKLTIISEKEFVLLFENQVSIHLKSDSTMVLWSVITEITNCIRELSGKRDYQLKYEWMKSYENRPMDDFTLKAPESKESDRPLFAYQQKKNQSVREIWIRNKLKERADEYTHDEKIKVVCGTWNVNCKFPKSPGELSEWLQLDELPDILAIGLQEVDMSATALLREETEAFEKWDRIFSEAVRFAKKRYISIVSKQLVGIYLIVFVREDRLTAVTDPRVQTLGCGALGSMGNKGCVAIRFQFSQSTMCFVSSHLAAHQNSVEKRNQNWSFLEQGINFDDDPQTYNCKRHDILFWLGDLNYRIDLPYEVAKKRIMEGNITRLLQRDQLGYEKKKKRTFVGYDESEITFRPTYKFDPGTSVYDTSEKKRVPSYTDRIQWKKNDGIKCLLYTCYDKYFISDHKPVSGIYEVNIKEVVQEKYNKLMKEFIRTLDKVENEMRPEVDIPCRDLSFENVEFGAAQTQTMTLRNSGKVVCEFRFVSKRGGKMCKPWVKIAPKQGIVIPGESMVIKISVNVDLKTVSEMNKNPNFEDILILHLKNGGDHFVSIKGNYSPSCVGCSIKDLLLYEKGVKERGSKLDPSDPRVKQQRIPKEVWHIVNYLHKNAMKEKFLFMETGRKNEVQMILSLLDHGKSLEDFHGSNHSMAQALLVLLKNLEEPVIPYRFHRLAVMMSKLKVPIIYKEFLLKKKRVPPKDYSFPAEHFNLFQYITSFLRELLKPKYSQNGLKKEKLAIVFSKVLMRSKGAGTLSIMSKESESDEKGKIMFMKRFLDYQNEWNNPNTGLLLRDDIKFD